MATAMLPNVSIFEAKGAHEDRYGCMQGLIWAHARA